MRLFLILIFQFTVQGQGISGIGPGEAQKLRDAGARMVDVREKRERIQSYIPGTDFLPLSQLGSTSLNYPKTETVILQCRSGRRSLKAAKELVRRGYTSVYNLEGGLIGWEDAGLEVLQPRQTLKTTARRILKRLKSVLMQTMKTQGPVGAVQTCSIEALKLTTQDLPATVTAMRTSSKVRNPKNSPSAFQSSRLARMDTRESAVFEEHEAELHYFKPLRAGALCLSCHGKQIAEPVLQKLQTLYPKDQAQGYELGEFRGMLHLKMPLWERVHSRPF